MNVSEDDELSIFIISYISHQIQKLETKVIRRFPKISQSQRRPLLELSHLKHQAKQDMLINLPVPYDNCVGRWRPNFTVNPRLALCLNSVINGLLRDYEIFGNLRITFV